jgi:hypothetical protein
MGRFVLAAFDLIEDPRSEMLRGEFSVVTAFDYYSQSLIEALDRWYAYGDRSKLSPREFGPWSEDIMTRTLRNIVGGTVRPVDFQIRRNRH